MWADRIRWLILLGFLALVDGSACWKSWDVATTPEFSMGGGSPGYSWYSRLFADGRGETVVTNQTTGVVTLVPISPPTLMGRVKVWWWAILGLAFTGLTIGFARTDRGWRFIKSIGPPRLSIRGWMIAIGLIAIELGLVMAMRTDRAVDPNWSIDPAAFVLLHVVAFYFLGIVLMVRIRLGREER